MRYLSQEEKSESRKLWEEAFPDDSKEFVDYYYSEKVKENRILIQEIDGDIVSMAHMNPYAVMVKGREWKVDYVVGVATAAAHRKQGLMRSILSRMLMDMRAEGMPFCYLMPAAEGIYLPFLFTYVFNQPKWVLKEGLDVEWIKADLSQNPVCTQIGDWQEAWLALRYQVYCRRTAGYIRQLGKELASEAGEMTLLYRNRNLVGTRCVWGRSKKEQRALLCEEELGEETSVPKPAIMGRIVDVEGFVHAISLRQDADVEGLNVIIGIEDEFLEENAGVFCWTLDKEASSLTRLENQEQEPDLTLNISQMTAWLFGYKPLTKLLEHYVVVPKWCDFIQVLEGIYLDEAV